MPQCDSVANAASEAYALPGLSQSLWLAVCAMYVNSWIHEWLLLTRRWPATHSSRVHLAPSICSASSTLGPVLQVRGMPQARGLDGASQHHGRTECCQGLVVHQACMPMVLICHQRRLHFRVVLHPVGM